MIHPEGKPPPDPVEAAFVRRELHVDARLRHLARGHCTELRSLADLIWLASNPVDAPALAGSTMLAAVEEYTQTIGGSLGFSNQMGVETWTQRNLDTLYEVTSAPYQARINTANHTHRDC
jgi:hypothetical protein